MLPEVATFSRPFTNEIKMYDELLRKAKYFQDQMATLSPALSIPPSVSSSSSSSFSPYFAVSSNRDLSIEELQHLFQEREKDLIQLGINCEELVKARNDLVQYYTVVDKANDI